MTLNRTSARGFRRWLTPFGVAAIAVTVLAPAGPVRAASDYTVPIPLHPAPAGLRLIGASAAGVAVQQDDVDGGYPAVNPVFTGPTGGELTRRSALNPTLSSSYSPEGLTVVGSTLAWTQPLQRAGSRPYEANRLNILTGENQKEAGTIGAPATFNGESWFSHEVIGYADLPENWQRPLRRYHAGTQDRFGMRTDILIPNVKGVIGGPLTSDAGAALRATRDGATGLSALDLVTLKDGTVTRIAEGPEEIAGVALGGGLLVWATKTADGFAVHQRPRAGGDVVTYAEPDANADVGHMVAGEAGVAYLVNHQPDPGNPSADSTGIVIVDGEQAHRRDLTYTAAGLAAVGDHFLTASAGYAGFEPYYSDTAGVYQVTEDEFVRVATVPAATLPAQQLSLSAGLLRYSDASGPAYPGAPAAGRPVFQRTVTGQRRAKFSEESRIGARTSGQMVFSAARGVLGVPDQQGVWQLLDRGQETATIEAAGEKPNVSGPYTLVGGRVFRPDGEQIYTEPTPAGTTSGDDDLFGPRIVYVRTDGAGASTIWVDDAERPAPVELAAVDAGCDGSTPRVSVWGELVAWTTSCGERAYVRNLVTGATREAAVGAAHGRLSLSEGTLSWSHDGFAPVGVIDLTGTHLAPVVLPGGAAPAAVDDHRVARQVREFPWSLTVRTEMSPLPFTRKLRPRLIAALGPLGFSPDGDGRGDVWAPQFDLTKPMRSVELTIQNPAGTKTVARIDGTAPDGSVRDLRWNGLSSKGMQLPGGTYRWTLSGRSADGDGTLIGRDGAAVVSGTIDLELG
ncbi:hypothetical protein KIH74_30395 [Kineosporia sp. J2-2]|uniref:FlgD/Vpr Ig-like domain-containing protein n=1 Tax=Kineosporia corallincola TaxID=2835133 RepID=A0ABS5TR16_9ACTN|nr:FlgD immunoglobulin-like domain containing protein [Kineosporia corallincola]MBT0773294.1 hypothetical protein [Kineosporia corallincola]